MKTRLKAVRIEYIYYLEQFASGQTNDLVPSYMHMEPERGYEHAKKLLKKKYGNKYKIGMAYIEKAMSWPPIKSEDSSAPESFCLPHRLLQHYGRHRLHERNGSPKDPESSCFKTSLQTPREMGRGGITSHGKTKKNWEIWRLD